MSVKTFKPNFHPADFKGPLAANYPEREDLYQNLVGAFLWERFGQRVHVAPTKGIDGSIDIFIEEGADTNETFLDLPLPLIVECKDHDDTLGKVKDNVQAGWKKVQDKLIKKAKDNWNGTFRPWKQAKGYLYCVSAVMPHQQARTDISSSINDFFFNLPETNKPSIEKTHLLDWSDLHSLLNGHSRLIDNWLGISHEGIIGHEEYVAGLIGFREYLKEENLSYILPGSDNPTHPGNLLNALVQKAGASGVILIGTGGVGKTRACFEVAKLAHRQGWRVLHIIPGEPSVTVEEIENVVFQGTTKTLLAFDYLEQLRGIDWGAVRHRLLPAAKNRAILLALLANARPGVLLKDVNTERDSIFQRIELVITDREEQISAHFQETLAPNATRILGFKRVRELCGTRPIIGMFIARELERYAIAGQLNDTVTARLRDGDLQSWIQRRFQEDGLMPRVTEELLPPMPSPVMIAAAAGLAAAPLRRNEMEAVLESSLRTSHDELAEQKAPLLLNSLIRSGWLEERDIKLSVPHDVIADELLELTLCDKTWQIIRPGSEEKIFVRGISSPRVLGHFSVSLDRILGQTEFPGNLRKQLKESLVDWLARHMSELGMSLIKGEADEVSYALGAVVSGLAWHDVVFQFWESLITPWLEQNSNSADARHLLYKGLKGLPIGESDKIEVYAIKWINAHSLIKDASFIISPLLERTDLTQDSARSAVDAALAWLMEHGKTIEAGFVLDTLLGRADLTQDSANRAVDAALAWLIEHGKTIEAGFVLDTLLGRADLTQDSANRAIDAALAWLSEHGKTIDANFVLPPLLGRHDLTQETAKGVISVTLDWLAIYGITIEAQFVLKSLLEWTDLTQDSAKRAVDAALAWLTEHGKTIEAGFVLDSLLGRTDLTQDTKKYVISVALDWLDNHYETTNAEFVLKHLLGKSNLNDNQKISCIKLAILRLEKVYLSPEASFLLRYCLNERTLAREERAKIIASAVLWLRANAKTNNIDFVFKKLLRNPTISDAIWRETADIALEWLQRTPLAFDRDHTLNSFIERLRLLTPEEKLYLEAESEKWLKTFTHVKGKEKERMLTCLKRLKLSNS